MASAQDIRAGGAYVELSVKDSTAAGFAGVAAGMQNFQTSVAGLGASLSSAFDIAKLAVPFGAFAEIGKRAFSAVVGTAGEAAAHIQQALSEQMGRSNSLRSPAEMTLDQEDIGKPIWVRARWISTRGEPGPWSLAQSTVIA